MAITNNKTFILTDTAELSIQISLSGLSFCVLNRARKTIELLEEVIFNKQLSPIDLLDQVKAVFNTFQLGTGSFSKVQIIHVNALSTLVPKALFNEDTLADYLKFNSKILANDFIAHDAIVSNESVNVYVPFMNINNFIFETFGNFTYKHYSTILIEQLLQLEKNTEDAKLYVHIKKNNFEIVAINKGALLLYNTFQYSSKEDFIYYLLFTIEQLGFNPETILVIIIGITSKTNENYQIAYKYVRNITLSTPIDGSIKTSTDNYHHFFTLLTSF